MHGVCWDNVKTIQEALFHAPSPVHQQSDLGDEVDGMKGDTVKLLSDEDGHRKRECLVVISQDSPFFQVVSSGISLMARLHFGRWTTTATAPTV